jgi:hypothetical protein
VLARVDDQAVPVERPVRAGASYAILMGRCPADAMRPSPARAQVSHSVELAVAYHDRRDGAPASAAIGFSSHGARAGPLHVPDRGIARALKRPARAARWYHVPPQPDSIARLSSPARALTNIPRNRSTSGPRITRLSTRPRSTSTK